ncbi:unnamed protein product [Microthlaspi erraticum]|uniref:MATH domain-containing protein n=1 Tax=Microthlaspi erraticum TaxID=1685480 RepID=A0A6D2J4Y7_9BRAS|nr:unnamed protein product [Microthlaspi erraticum]
MGSYEKTSFRFEIDNFWKKKSAVTSRIFVSGGCNWYVEVCHKGYGIEDYLSVYLNVPDTKSLRPGWKRRAKYRFIVLNQSGKELKGASETCSLFCGQFPGWGYSKLLPLNKLKEEGFLEKNKLIIKVEVEVVELVHEAEVTGTEMLYIKGFNVRYTQANSVLNIFAEHPDIAVDFKPKNQVVKTEYMNVLLSLIKTLNKPAKVLSETKLSDARSEFRELTEAGFKLDWLQKKFEEVSLEMKKVVSHDARVQELEERITKLKLELDNEKIKSSKVLSLEQTVSKLKVELDNEKAKSFKVLSLEQRVSKLKVELDNEKAKSSKVLSLEEAVSKLKVELYNEKAKSSKVLSLKSSDLEVELDKERSAKSGTSKTVSLIDDVCFWRHMGIRERMAGYRKLK